MSFTGDLGRGLLEGWLFNGWKREGSSPGHQSGVRGLCYTHCKAPILGGRHMIGSGHDVSALRWLSDGVCFGLWRGGGVHPSPDSTERVPPTFCASARNDMHHPTGSPLTSICQAVSSNHREGWEMQSAEVGRASQVKGGPRRVETSSR